MADFQSHQEALECADNLVAQNAKDYQHKVPRQWNDNPLLVRCWYVHGEGTKRKFKQEEEKEMSGAAPVSNKKALTESGAFMEGLGAPAGSGGEAKIENLAYAEMNVSAEKLRTIDDPKMGGGAGAVSVVSPVSPAPLGRPALGSRRPRGSVGD